MEQAKSGIMTGPPFARNVIIAAISDSLRCTFPALLMTLRSPCPCIQREPARQADNQPPQRRQVLALRLERDVIVEDAERFTEVVWRRLDPLLVGHVLAHGSTRSFDVRMLHDDTSISFILPT
jgi:hypothetical protein